MLCCGRPKRRMSTAQRSIGGSPPTIHSASAFPAPPPPAPQTVPLTLDEQFVGQVGDSVFFAFDQSTLSDDSQRTLDAQAAFLAANPAVTITIEGHADERGTDDYNLALGARRAAATRDYLIARGVAAGRIQTISYGETRPFASGSNEAAWSQNRRAVTVLTGGVS